MDLSTISQMKMISADHSERLNMFINEIIDNDIDNDIDNNEIFNMAINYYRGIDCEVDLKKSFDYFNEASNVGNSKAKYILSLMHLYGIGTKIDIEQAVRWLKKAEKANVPEAIFDIGLSYSMGSHVARFITKKVEKNTSGNYNTAMEKDIEEFRKFHNYYNPLPDELNIEYQLSLLDRLHGLYHSDINPKIVVGLKNKVNIQLSMNYIEKAAELGCNLANQFVGELCIGGRTRVVNEEKAYYHFQKLKYRVKFRTTFFLGKLYLLGKYLPRDERKALELFFSEVDDGPPAYSRDIGKIYKYSEDPSIRDEEKAFRYFKQSAKLLENEGMYQVGLAYIEGQVVPQDIALGMIYELMAAHYKHSKAQVFIGECYEKGQYIEMSKDKAFRWYQNAVEQQDIDACYKLGCLHLNGEGVVRNYKKGLDLIKKAAINGHEEAKILINNLNSRK
jgi:TPR repeat protein